MIETLLNHGQHASDKTGITPVDPLVMLRAMAKRMEIGEINCSTCAYLGSDDDGGEPEYSVSWPVCNKFDRYQYLKSFPFKKEMKCWYPEFWHSKFANMVDGSDESMGEACVAFRAAIEA